MAIYVKSAPPQININFALDGGSGGGLVGNVGLEQQEVDRILGAMGEMDPENVLAPAWLKELYRMFDGKRERVAVTRRAQLPVQRPGLNPVQGQGELNDQAQNALQAQAISALAPSGSSRGQATPIVRRRRGLLAQDGDSLAALASSLALDNLGVHEAKDLPSIARPRVERLSEEVNAVKAVKAS